MKVLIKTFNVSEFSSYINVIIYKMDVAKKLLKMQVGIVIKQTLKRRALIKKEWQVEN